MISRVLRLAALPLFALPLFAAEAPPPKLAVTIVVDQFRADFLERFRPYFGEGGFKRLMDGGTSFSNAYHRHALTVTAPGHATVATGVFPTTHGIRANDWIDRDTWEQVNNVEDRDSLLVGVDPAEAGPAMLAPKAGRSPRNLQATTLADQLKLRFGDKSHVFTASNKDRSAILLGGKLADSAYWDESGRFITSRYYHDQLPAWVQAFDDERRVQSYFGKTWDRVLAPEIYDRVQGPDDAPGEAVANGLTRTFPKVINGGQAKISSAFYTAFDNSPFSSEFLGAFVQRAIKEEKLGHHEGIDFLGVSFSQIDTIGHSYGPDSHEVMDSMIRLDRVLAQVLDTLDREVGLANCVIVLTGDHGGTPLPEHVQALHGGAIPSGRVKLADIDAAAKKALDDKFGPQAENEYWFVRDSLGYHLRPTALAAKKITADEAARVLKTTLSAHPAIAQVYTRAELLAAEPEGDTILAKMRRSYYAPKDRDVVWVWKPYFMERPASGTTHGTPYDTDAHVPMVWFGAGVPKGVRGERVGTDDIAPTLAGLLHVPRPPQAMGRQLF